VSQFGVAALTAAGTGTLFAALVAALTLANRRLADPHDVDEHEAAVVAGGGLLSGVLFALLGARTLGAWLSLSTVAAVLVSLLGTVALGLVGTLLFRLLAIRYLRWARTPAVLREEREEGFDP
jgi:hypothetical protein